MKTELFMVIEPDGGLRAIYSDALVEVGLMDEGVATTARASHVEPAPSGGWQADMAPSGGPLLSGFALRSEALGAEVSWLKERMARP